MTLRATFRPALLALLLHQVAFAQTAPGPFQATTTPKDLITPAQSAVPQATEITSESVEMWSTDTENHGIFQGNVVVSGTNMRLTCDRLEIISTPIGDKTATIPTLEKFKYLLASGKVRIVQGDREATCGRAEVFPREDKIILTEEPMVTDHGNEAKYIGRKIEMFRGERRVHGEGVHLILPPIKDLGFDKNQPPPAAETPSPTTAPATTPPADANHTPAK